MITLNVIALNRHNNVEGGNQFNTKNIFGHITNCKESRCRLSLYLCVENKGTEGPSCLTMFFLQTSSSSIDLSSKLLLRKCRWL